jgi:hypothetical protein
MSDFTREESTTLGAIARRAYRDLVRSERTTSRWSDPLSIYSPDPTALAVAMFNLSRQERMVDLRQGLEDLRAHVAAAGSRGGQGRQGLPPGRSPLVTTHGVDREA